MMCILSQLKLFTKNAPFWCQRFVVVIHTLFVSIGSFHQLLRWQHWRYRIIGWQRHRTATTSDDREQRNKMNNSHLFAAVLGTVCSSCENDILRTVVRKMRNSTVSVMDWSLSLFGMLVTVHTPSADPWSAVWQGTECRGPVNNWWGGEMRLERTLTIAHHWNARESVYLWYLLIIHIYCKFFFFSFPNPCFVNINVVLMPAGCQPDTVNVDLTKLIVE